MCSQAYRFRAIGLLGFDAEGVGVGVGFVGVDFCLGLCLGLGLDFGLVALGEELGLVWLFRPFSAVM